MARGFVWALYVTDEGVGYGLKVDADSFGQASRGWSNAIGLGVQPLPRGWRARRVYGLEPDGSRHWTRVGTVECDLWTGVVNTFSVETNEGSSVTCTVNERRAERLLPSVP